MYTYITYFINYVLLQFRKVFYTNILQLASSDPSEQCITPSHTCALRIQASVLSQIKSSVAEHVILSTFQTNLKFKVKIAYCTNILNITLRATLSVLCTYTQNI